MTDGIVQRFRPVARQAAITAGLELAAIMSRFGVGKDAAGDGLIFTLHHVRPATATAFQPNRILDVTPGFLDAVLVALRELDYDFISLEEAADRLRAPPTGKRFACFTLDDGFRDNAVHAKPVFAAHGAPYTIFIAKGLSEGSHSAWWETLAALLQSVDRIEFDFGRGNESLPTATTAQKMVAFERLSQFVNRIDEAQAVAAIDALAARHGVDPLVVCRDLVMTPAELRVLAEDPLAHYGAHTISHRGLARLDDAEAEAEVADSAAYVAEITGRACRTFAYPYGDARSVSTRERERLKRRGLIGVTTRPGMLRAGGVADMQALPRVSLNGLYQKARYVRALASGLPFKLMG
ncbi:polysaccharide deacetylase family protein [Rhizobium sp. TRM95796]|nr:polysaccharide deacetylase family protein [Rhizobium sp. TRM95796]MCV3766379.1 polysaccharide deacetylase family protein [Rhizobium sp. TRM95796]